MKLILKVLLSILMSTALLLVGFYTYIIVAVSGYGRFYIGIVCIVFLFLWLFLLMQTWSLLKRKVRYITMVTMVALIFVSVVGFEISRAYHNSFERVDERELNLTLYDPFRANTLAVSLNEPSTLSLTENLPRLDGATALYPVYSAFVKAVYPANVQSKPNCSGTDVAYRHLILGETDIIFVAAPSEKQLQMAKEAGLEFNLTPIGREAFVFFVNSNNAVNELSINDILKIYSGKSTNWREFGCDNSSIRAFQRLKDSGSQTALVKLMGDIPLMIPPQEDVIEGMGDIIRKVSAYRNYHNAIEYSFLFFATEMVKNKKIKLLKINNIAPTRENVANRTYPYTSEFYAVTLRSSTSKTTKMFIQWILSEQGQRLIAKTGYTPLDL